MKPTLKSMDFFPHSHIELSLNAFSLVHVSKKFFYTYSKSIPFITDVILSYCKGNSLILEYIILDLPFETVTSYLIQLETKLNVHELHSPREFLNMM